MPNITRNAIVNCAELVTYDIIKELILKYDLMTGKVHGSTQSVKLGPTGECENPLSVIWPPIRQPALPLHRRLRRRLLHNGGGVSGGCGQDTIHELSIWSVQQRHQLCSHHAEARRSLCLL